MSRSTSSSTAGSSTGPTRPTYFEPLLNRTCGTTGNTNLSYYSNPRVTARIEAASRLSGEARRKAWADLDADLMRTDPPWAPLRARGDP